MKLLKAVFPFGLCAALATSGCAVNQMRVDDAKTVQSAITGAVSGAEAYLHMVDLAREDTTIALVVADPACGTVWPQVRADPDLGPASPAVGGFCAVEPTGDDRRLSTAPLAPELAPTLRLVQALGAYGAALAAAADEHGGESPTAPLLDALTLARDAQTTLGSRDAVPSATDVRVTAAVSLVQFFGDLLQESNTVDRLRKTLATKPDGVDGIAKSLEQQLRSWERARQGDASLRIAVSGWATAKIIAKRPPASADEGREALTAYYATRDAMDVEGRLAPALTDALEAVRQADRDLRRVLAPHPQLTQAERRRLRVVSRERLVTAFDRIAALASAIRSA